MARRGGTWVQRWRVPLGFACAAVFIVLARPDRRSLLIGGAVVLLVLGGLFLLLGRFGLDRLPGDLVFRRGNFTLYFPIGLMILLSVIGTIVLNIVLRR